MLLMPAAAAAATAALAARSPLLKINFFCFFFISFSVVIVV